MAKLHICPKVTTCKKMGSIIGHRIDYNGEGALRGQRHIPSQNYPKYPPPGIFDRTNTTMISKKIRIPWMKHIKDQETGKKMLDIQRT